MSIDKGELRGMASLDLIQALDAIAISRGIDRTQLVNQILESEVKKIAHEANLLLRMARGKSITSHGARQCVAVGVCRGQRPKSKNTHQLELMLVFYHH